ncbi:MAG TPA: hypothetical protein VL069_03715, partial [Opitutus sp.]|nr:hypothetical protein [Opitutus sp.]
RQFPRSSFTSPVLTTGPAESKSSQGAATLPPVDAIDDRPSIPAAGTSVADRLTMMRWFQQNGLATSPLIFLNDKVTPEFSRLYGLTSAQTDQMNQLYQRAREEFVLLKQNHAHRDPASTPAKLIVVVPPIPEGGGEIYSRFVADFSSVLGPELAPSFNDISGDVLEMAFGGFGLELNRYEIVREPAVNGWQFYRFKRIIEHPPIGTVRSPFSGEVSGRLTAEDFREKHPALSKFELPTIDTVGP